MPQNKHDLTQGNIKKHLIRLTGPMIFGILGLSIFNIVDTYFVGRLGTTPLAAISFTFPIIMVLNSLILGVGTGVMAAVSKAAGSKKHENLKSLIFDSLIFALLIAFLFMSISFLLLNSVLTWLGAAGETFKLAKTYLTIWLFGLPAVVFPMVGNGIIRSLGDTKTPAVIMLFAAGINLILDPLFIFGIWIFPEWGIAGAAFATVIGRISSFIISFYVLIKREKILVFHKRKIKDMTAHFKEVLSVAAPDSLSKVIIPFGSGVITAMIAKFGESVIAGFGIAVKLEMFILIVAYALASVIVPFAGQNIGAGKIDRVKKILEYTQRFSIILQFIIYAVIFFTAPYFIKIFTKNDEVLKTAVLYLRIVPLAYAFKSITLSDCALLNVMQKPLEAAGINLIQMYVIFIPLALLFKSFWNVPGIFAALSVSLVLTAGIAAWRVRKRINDLNNQLTKSEG